MKSNLNIPYQKIAKNSGYVILAIFLFFIVFSIYLNTQDLNQLDVKNSTRRKIQDSYSDENIDKSRSKFFLYRQNEKFKKLRGSFKSDKIFDVSQMKSNIKDYKKKMRKKKITS